MTCEDLDTLLHPFVDGEFDDAERLVVETHLSTCTDCSRKVVSLRQYKQAIRARVDEAPVSHAPDSLRQNLIAGLHREQRARTWRQILAMGSAAAVAIAAGAVTWSLIPRARERFVMDAARRHARALPPEIRAAHDEIERWFGGKLDHRVPVPRFANTTLSGARLSNVEEKPAAYIRYEKRDPKDGANRSIGLFVFDDVDDDVDAQPLPAVAVERQAGYNVALWRDGEIVYEMVTDLDEQDILDLLAAQQRGAASARLPATSPTPPPLPSAPVPDLKVTPASLQR
ncbi:MAG: zf-HC2 domain-containing protein [Myxococcaceae bacterium]|nr:zf-HC2 domain-containing protein [Myxococcaceae bacterium]